MARIRTVKPELLTHEDLFLAEQQTGFPLRIAFVGLFTMADREGRFKWRPGTLKLGVLPFDQLDFSRVLDALASRGFICKYQVDGVDYGVIPTFGKHQVINNRESRSEIPEPEENSFISMTSTRESRVNDASYTPLMQDKGEGKGRERNGREEEGNSCAEASPSVAALPAVVKPKVAKEPAPTGMIWQAYSQAYWNRYGVEPVRNAKVNGQLAQLLTRLGAQEAPAVAQWFLTHNNRWYVQQMHSVDSLLRDAEKLRTEWATGNRMTVAAAQEADRRQETGDMWSRIIEEHEAKGNQ